MASTTPPSFPFFDWGFVEWTLTGLATIMVAIVSFVWGTRSKLREHSLIIDQHEKALEILASDAKDTRDLLSRHPTREDLRDDIRRIEDMITNRFDRIDKRIDAFTRKGGVND